MDVSASPTPRISSSSTCTIRSITSSHRPSLVCLNSRILGYHGVSSRSVSQRQSAARGVAIHTGTPKAPDTIATTGPAPTASGIGEGDLTRVVQHVDATAADDRVTQNLFDFRDRLIATKQGAQATETDGANRLITYFNLDNLGETAATFTYAGDGVSLNDFTNWTLSGTDPSKLRAYNVNLFDDQGRVYQGQQFSVDPSNGTVGSDLVSNTVFDHRGDVIASFAPGGLVTKHSFDGADRDIKDSTTDGGVLSGAAQPGTSGGWTAASSTSGDVVIEQTLNTFDGDSNQIEAEQRQRFDDDPTTATGDLAGPSGGNLASRDYFNGGYFDGADRLTDTVNVGTNSGTAWTRPSTAPTGSDIVLVNHTDYDNGGRVLDTIDPRGIKSGNFYDLMGRTTESIAAWDGTQNPTPTNSTNQITNYTFDGNGDVLTMTAVQPTGGTTPNQTTAYVYGTTGTIGTNLFSNDLVAQVDYPDKTTGNAAIVASEQQSFGYNFQGDKTTFTDQNGTTHTYNFDVLDRLTADIVTALGSGVDGAVRRLGFSFNDAGLPYQQTSYSDTGGNTVVNQVQDAYNGYGQLVTQYQEHSGAVNTATSLKVQYVYSQPTGANFSRMTAMIYPNGRQLDDVYNSGLDTTISRVSGLSDDSGSAAGNDQSLTYLGLNTIVQALDGNGIELTYIKQTGESNGDAGDKYIGLDRFGRVVDQRWIPVSAPNSPTDRFQYGYDRDSNVLYKSNLVNSLMSELYHANSAASGDDNTAYDPLARLTAFHRGTLSASGNNGATLDTVSTPAGLIRSDETWSLDALGNWSGFAINGTPASNTFNAQNQETNAGGGVLTYDNNGNMISDDFGQILKYDAWNRLVSVSGGASMIYAYAADGNLIQRTLSGVTTDFYVSQQGQNLEERQGSTVTNQYVWGLAYVNDLVLRDDNSTGGDYGLTGSGLGERIYVQHDANWNVTALTNTAGAVLERYIYTPYGLRETMDPNWNLLYIGQADYNWMYGFQGGWYEFSDRVMRFGARNYSPTLGRWMQQDPAGYIDGANIYTFVVDHPESTVDPTGFDYYWLGGGSAIFYNLPYDLYGYTPPSDNDATGDDILIEFFNMVGPRDRYFGPDAFMTDVIKDHKGVNSARQQAQDALKQLKCKPCDQQPQSLPPIKIDFGPTNPIWDISRMVWNRWSRGRGGNMGFVGSYHGTITFTKVSCGHYQMHFHIDNTTSYESGGNNGPPNRPIRQHWYWDENWDMGPTIGPKK